MISKNKLFIAVTIGFVFVAGLIFLIIREQSMPEDESLSSGYSVTRSDSRNIDNNENVLNYSYQFQEDLQRAAHEYTLAEVEYCFWDELIFLEEDEYPQGLCIAEDYILISSYSERRGDLGKIKVYDKHSGKHLISLGVDENSHLGGLTYDGTYIWICNSYEMALERIPYAFIEQAIEEHIGTEVDIRNLVDAYSVRNIPSAVSYYGGYLWVATHSILTKSDMVGYVYDEKYEKLSPTIYMDIPPKVQGVAFTKQGEVFLSLSYGRRSSSYLKKYHSLKTLDDDADNYKECIELPPCSEGIFYVDNQIYVLFESAAKKYFEGTDGRGESEAPINRILIIEKK